MGLIDSGNVMDVSGNCKWIVLYHLYQLHLALEAKTMLPFPYHTYRLIDTISIEHFFRPSLPGDFKTVFGLVASGKDSVWHEEMVGGGSNESGGIV